MDSRKEEACAGEQGIRSVTVRWVDRTRQVLQLETNKPKENPTPSGGAYSPGSEGEVNESKQSGMNWIAE